MHLGADGRGQSIQIGAVLLFGVLIIFLSVWQAFVVPDQNEEVEFNHNQDVQQQLVELRSTVTSMPDAASTRSQSIDLGIRYPARTIFVNPGPASGTIRTNGTTDESVAIAFENLSAPGSVGDFWNDTDPYNTGSIVYDPDYRRYANAPETVYEHSLLYNDFSDDGTGETSLPLTGQSVVEDDQITLVTLNGTYFESRVGSTSIDFRPISTETKTIPVTNDTGGPLTVRIPTRLDNSTWEDVLRDEEEFTDQGGHVVSVDEGPDGTVEIVFEDGDYDLQLAKVGLGTKATATEKAYITDIEGDGVRLRDDETRDVTVEVRDPYNGPVRGVEVNASATLDADFGDGTRRTDSDGQVTLQYSPDGTFATDQSDQLNFTIEDGYDPVASHEASTPMNLTMDVTVEGTQSDQTTVDPAYEIEWDLDSFGGDFDCDVATDTCSIPAGTTNANMSFGPVDPQLNGFAQFSVANRTVATLNTYSTEFEGNETVQLNANNTGTTNVTVFAGGDRDTVTIAVAQPRLTLDAANDEITAGDSNQLTATYQNPTGGETVSWTLLQGDGSLANTDGSLTNGEATATYNSAASDSGTVDVQVTVAGETATETFQVTQPQGPNMQAGDGAAVTANNDEIVFYLTNAGSSDTIERVRIDQVTNISPTPDRLRDGDPEVAIDRGFRGEINKQNWDIGTFESVSNSGTIPADGIAQIRIGEFTQQGGGNPSVDMDGATVNFTVEYGDTTQQSFSVDIIGEYQDTATGASVQTTGEIAIIDENVGGNVITNGGDVILDGSNVGGNINSGGGDVVIRDGDLGGVFQTPPDTLRLIGNWNLANYSGTTESQLESQTGANEVIIVP
jgi:hypothetical protein